MDRIARIAQLARGFRLLAPFALVVSAWGLAEGIIRPIVTLYRGDWSTDIPWLQDIPASILIVVLGALGMVWRVAAFRFVLQFDALMVLYIEGRVLERDNADRLKRVGMLLAMLASVPLFPPRGLHDVWLLVPDPIGLLAAAFIVLVAFVMGEAAREHEELQDVV